MKSLYGYPPYPPNPCYDRKTGKDCPNRKAMCSKNCKEWKEYMDLKKRDSDKRYMFHEGEVATNDFLYESKCRILRRLRIKRGKW